MRYTVLYRRSFFDFGPINCPINRTELSTSLKEDEGEIEAARQAGFVLLDRRTDIRSGDLVIARFSCLPFYVSLEQECQEVGAKLINSWKQHQYLSDLGNYIGDLKELTFQTWEALDDLPETGPFVLKGGFHSRKDQWQTHMWAADKQAAREVYARLMEDELIGQQPIYIRKFIPLVTYLEGDNGLPITKEFRFFVCNGKIFASGFYWSRWSSVLEKVPSPEEVPKEFLQEVIRRIASNPNAPTVYAMDIAIQQTGEPIVVELNDLQLAGLSAIEPRVFYQELMTQLQSCLG